jgi:polyhydroxyalkanoate synthesis regulator phasin
MSSLKERLFKLMQDPRVAEMMRDPQVQELAVKAFRLRGRVEGAFERNVQLVAGRLNLATQKDLRGLHRRIRHLEQELREAEERLNDPEAHREAPDRS